jgi:hypothetical protein
MTPTITAIPIDGPWYLMYVANREWELTTRCCRSVGLLERLQLQVESGHSMLFEIRKPECVL